MLSSVLKTSKLAFSSHAKDGFTLTELLVAGALTATVVGVSGVGLTSMLSSSSDSGAQNERRIELNRSLEFIAAEVRQAERIEPNANQNLSSNAPAFDATDKVPVLTLTVPGVSQRIIYYLAAAEGLWRGPQAIYRWGPSFQLDGQYDDTTPPAAWQYEPLIDRISDQASTPDCPQDQATTPETPWTANPSTNATGFYACVNPSGQVAQVFHKGQLRKVLDNPEAYALDTKVFARTSPTSLSNAASGFTPTLGGLSVDSGSSITISNLGGALQCSNGNNVNNGVSGTAIMTSQNSGTSSSVPLPAPGSDMVEEVDADTELRFTAQVNGTACIRNLSVSSVTDLGRQVLVYENGDNVPEFEAFLDQGEIASFLTNDNPITGRPYLDPDTLQISLAENQRIFLFELGVDFDSNQSLESQGDAFDMQDLVIVATITPNEQ